MIFKHSAVLWLFLIFIPLIAWYIWKQKNANASLGVSSLSAFAKMNPSWKVWLIRFCFVLQLVAIGACIVALARPQTTDSKRNSRIVGTDIALALDISGSMSATDFRPTRFAAAKDVAAKFISNRANDNMALVVFAGESLSLMPLTNDRAALINALKNVEMGDLQDGTAIGDGLSSAINRLASGKAKSKSIILLTDGTNNAGDVPPSTAAKIAASKGIRIYTVGVGTDGTITVRDPYGFASTTLETKIDEESLKNMANATGGKYFRATDERMLERIFNEIDQLEKTKLDVDRFTRVDENFMPWVWIAVCALGLMLLIRYTVLRRIP